MHSLRLTLVPLLLNIKPTSIFLVSILSPVVFHRVDRPKTDHKDPWSPDNDAPPVAIPPRPPPRAALSPIQTCSLSTRPTWRFSPPGSLYSDLVRPIYQASTSCWHRQTRRLWNRGGSSTGNGRLGPAVYSSSSILQPSILRPPLIIRPPDLVPRGNFSVLNNLSFKTAYNIRPHFLGPMGGLKIERPLYMIYLLSVSW